MMSYVAKFMVKNCVGKYLKVVGLESHPCDVCHVVESNCRNAIVPLRWRMVLVLLLRTHYICPFCCGLSALILVFIFPTSIHFVSPNLGFSCTS